jgi:hypothetical protein
MPDFLASGPAPDAQGGAHPTQAARELGRCKATWKGELTLPWREAGPPNHLYDKVNSLAATQATQAQYEPPI